jgi:hypothetical protein
MLGWAADGYMNEGASRHCWIGTASVSHSSSTSGTMFADVSVSWRGSALTQEPRLEIWLLVNYATHRHPD